jgi:epoxyqueuosine reductase
VIPPRLRALSSFISDQVSVQINSRIYTDTGPILERELAQHAGLGWIGKNTCLIHPKLGSYFLLAELFLDIPLEPDPPFLPDRCGNCTRCIQACPTACILPDRTIDSRRCISYLTIELKKIIPMSLRPLMGPWIFGCDICQAVCPWNVHFAEGPGSIKPDSALAPRPGLPIPDLLLELALSSHAFNQKFRGNPIQRPHRRGYLRNVAIALGNSSDPSAIPVLVETLLRDPEPLVRGASAWALGQIGGSVAHQILSTAMSSETSEAVLHEIDTALHKV